MSRYCDDYSRAVLMLVKNACSWKICMLVKDFHQHSPPKLHDVGENNVGEVVCWRKKICSLKTIYMLVKIFLYVGKKYFRWWNMYVGEICMLVKYVFSPFFTDEYSVGDWEVHQTWHLALLQNNQLKKYKYEKRAFIKTRLFLRKCQEKGQEPSS